MDRQQVKSIECAANVVAEAFYKAGFNRTFLASSIILHELLAKQNINTLLVSGFSTVVCSTCANAVSSRCVWLEYNGKVIDIGGMIADKFNDNKGMLTKEVPGYAIFDQIDKDYEEMLKNIKKYGVEYYWNEQKIRNLHEIREQLCK